MASQRYPEAMAAYQRGEIDMLADDIVALIYSGSYLATDAFIADLAGTILGRSGSLTGKTVLLGVFDADNEEVTGTVAGSADAVLIAKDTGDDATSRVIAYLELTPAKAVTGAGASLIWNTIGIFEL